MQSKIIFFELNEVPYRILDQYCRWHPQSRIAQLLNFSSQYETVTEDGNLSPWTTWPTVHRGVVDQAHTIHEFGQELSEIDEAYPPLWRLLNRAGVKTGVCGSLHSYPMPSEVENYAFYLPDTFAAGSECFPKKLSLFQEFNLKMARDSARVVSKKIHWGPALRLLASAPELGFRFQTAVDVAGQLMGERLQAWKKIRRRTYQTVLAFDVFMRQLERTRPDFVTFFTNHVASSMHRYWAATFPEDYERFNFGDDWVRTYRNEIDFTMGKFEEFLGRLIRFVDANPEYALWVTTSMGQSATETKEVETKLMVSDFDKFSEQIGLSRDDWERRPAMIPQTNFVVREGCIEPVRSCLESIVIAGKPLKFYERENGFFSITIGHENVHEGPREAQVSGRLVSFDDLGLVIKKIDDKCGSTAYHMPKGMLLIYEPRALKAYATRTQISTVDIAPQLLENFAVPLPGYMRGRCFHHAAADTVGYRGPVAQTAMQ